MIPLIPLIKKLPRKIIIKINYLLDLIKLINRLTLYLEEIYFPLNPT